MAWSTPTLTQTPIDYVIPSNDDAIRAVKLIVSIIANAAEEGMRIREVDMADTGQVSRSELAEMEQYLGPSTLAKLQTVDEDDDDDADPYADLCRMKLSPAWMTTMTIPMPNLPSVTMNEFGES